MDNFLQVDHRVVRNHHSLVLAVHKRHSLVGRKVAYRDHEGADQAGLQELRQPHHKDRAEGHCRNPHQHRRRLVHNHQRTTDLARIHYSILEELQVVLGQLLLDSHQLHSVERRALEGTIVAQPKKSKA